MQYVTTMLGVSVVRVPGLHDSSTATGNPGSRAQDAGEFARLERERARLEDKLSALAVARKQTEARLEVVCQRAAILRRRIAEPSQEAVAGPRPAPVVAAPRAVPAPDAEEEQDDSMEPYKVIPFEY
jgi:hypothetical protein